jgi:hypothetical protein
MDTLIILKEFQKVVPVRSLMTIAIENSNTYNNNILWEELLKKFDVENQSCLVQPLLIHQHQFGVVGFPHFRCLVELENIPIVLLQDLSFEQWAHISR